MTSKGGYHPQARLETTRDELVMEALTGANHPSEEVRRKTFDEIARLARRCQELLDHVLGGTVGAAAASA
jgi:hypothetical protein